jgi:hypothetical protein
LSEAGGVGVVHREFFNGFRASVLQEEHIWRVAEQQYKYALHCSTVHLGMVKLANFVVFMFYHQSNVDLFKIFYITHLRTNFVFSVLPAPDSPDTMID